ncbi:hypothetical protein SISNIDRAFT_462259 [Sistotremastrum niveocremeum HHB9708]|uniref:DUF6535 domain-containing protein n=1 Tax=Sistotremastrum niveocremeum HHB9708 TaxID=1314777 RepID=A0A164ZYP6_9AGAM|nr:hypothetical protein SISNIDRAFT_462259 [Sistotremastrum niveocremeum HHB9708]
MQAVRADCTPIPVYSALPTPAEVGSEPPSYQEQLLVTLQDLSSLVQRQSTPDVDFIKTVCDRLEDQTKVLLKIDARLKEQSESLKTHSACLEALKSDAMKDELPASGRDWQDQVAWRAMFQSVMSRTKEQVEIWKGGMDATLIFIALFLTVVTAFVIPATQNLSGNPAAVNITVTVVSPTNVTISSPHALPSSPATPLPSLTDQFVCFLFYTSLIISILTALLCVYGRRWTGRLTSVPKCKTFLEKTMRHMEMKKMADRWVEPLLTLSHSSLIASIILFLAGLLFQLWSLSLAFDVIAPILVTMCSLQTALSLTVCFFIAATVWHAVVYMNSPFQSPFSTFLQTVAKQWLRIRISDKLKQVTLTLKEWTDTPDQQTWEQVQSVHLDAKSTYTQLVMDTSDPDLLALSAPALSDIGSWEWSWVDGRTEDWSRYRDLFDSVLEATIRLLDSDTSDKTKLTVMGQMHNLGDTRWRFVTAQDEGYQDKMQKQFRRLLDVTRDLYCDAYFAKAEHRKYYFVGQYFLVDSLNDTLEDEYRETYPVYEYEEVLLRTLAEGFEVFSSESANGSPFCSLFNDACGELELLSDTNKAKLDEVLSIMDRASVVKSLLLCPNGSCKQAKLLLKLIIRDKQSEIWNDPEIIDILSELPAACRRNDHGEILVLEYISMMYRHFGPEIYIPEALDLSSILTLACTEYSNMKCPDRYSRALVGLVAQSPPVQFNDRNVVRRFLELCASHKKARESTVHLAEQYLAHNFPGGFDPRMLVAVNPDLPDEDEDVAADDTDPNHEPHEALHDQEGGEGAAPPANSECEPERHPHSKRSSFRKSLSKLHVDKALHLFDGLRFRAQRSPDLERQKEGRVSPAYFT